MRLLHYIESDSWISLNSLVLASHNFSLAFDRFSNFVTGFYLPSECLKSNPRLQDWGPRNKLSCWARAWWSAKRRTKPSEASSGRVTVWLCLLCQIQEQRSYFKLLFALACRTILHMQTDFFFPLLGENKVSLGQQLLPRIRKAWMQYYCFYHSHMINSGKLYYLRIHNHVWQSTMLPLSNMCNCSTGTSHPAVACSSASTNSPSALVF